jgi:hypothetical protein
MRRLQWNGLRARVLLGVLAPAAMLWPGALSGQQPSPFQTGDVFAGVGFGVIKQFSPDGTLRTFFLTEAGINLDDTGMAFDSSGSLYATVFEANKVYTFDNQGIRLGTFGSGYNSDPESIVFDNAGNAYIGQADGTRQILKFNSAGMLLDAYSPQLENRGTDWIDLAADQCTMHYTSEGGRVKQYNVCTRTQLPDFAVGLSGPCYGHRIRPNGEELVACTRQVYRLNRSGGVVQTYSPPGTSVLFALNLDPDNKSFWTGNLVGGSVFRIDIATGAVLTQFNADVYRALAGLAVAGELTAATTAPPSTTSYYVTTFSSSTLHRLGVKLAHDQLAAGIAEDTTVALLFRAPLFKNGEYGVAANGSFMPLSTVAKLVEAFAVGYYNSLEGNPTLHTRIIIGTSNGTTQCGGNQVTFNHGRAWAQMVNEVAAQVVVWKYHGQVDIAGGSDMEAAASAWPRKSPCGAFGKRQWVSATDTRDWVDGYASVSPQRFLYDVGDAGGCPFSDPAGQTAHPGPCNGGWTQEDVRYKSWGATPSQPLPEIYTANQATQWTRLSLYSYLRFNESMIIAGTLTQLGARCKQLCANDSCNPECARTFSPEQGWKALYEKLHEDTRTRQTLPWSTDITWNLK